MERAVGTNGGPKTRRLVIVLGDQLSHSLAGLRALNPERDRVWMAESEEEIEYLPSHKLRIAVFLSAMRHFRDGLLEEGIEVEYHAVGPEPAGEGCRSLPDLLEATLLGSRPERVVLTHPGDHRVLAGIRERCRRLDVALDVLPDDRFLCDLDEFRNWARGRKRLVLEDFYRWMRKRHGVLMEADRQPTGGRWNFDEENRESFGRDGPPPFKAPRRFRTDETTDEVIRLVEARWPAHPGRLDGMDLPVTHEEALAALRDFLEHRLDPFGTYQDAMWSDRTFLAHSRLSTPLNLGLLDPLHCVSEAERAYREKGARLASVEGFVRQVMGWREFVRGLYWLHMPDYAEMNHLGAERAVPSFLWDGETEMECVARAMSGVLDHAYAHHIQRLMVLGLFCLLYGVDPASFNRWHMAMFADAVDWVSLPNALGMSQFGDGGIVGTKPYCASGRYIDRMSDHCRRCRYDPTRSTGDDACPFTTLYWDFLARHEELLRQNHRMGFQLANLERKKGGELDRIRRRAREVVARVEAGERI